MSLLTIDTKMESGDSLRSQDVWQILPMHTNIRRRQMCILCFIWTVVIVSGGLMLDRYIQCESAKGDSINNGNEQRCRPTEIGAFILLSMALLPILPAIMWCNVRLYECICRCNHVQYSTIV